MIYVECSIINYKTNKLAGKYLKTFEFQGDFNSWYAIAKKDDDLFINIMRYNPQELSGQKSVYDAKLINMSRGNVT